MCCRFPSYRLYVFTIDPDSWPLCAFAPLRDIHTPASSASLRLCGRSTPSAALRLGAFARDPHLRPISVLASLREIHTPGSSASWRPCEEFTYHRRSSAKISGISGRSTPSAALRLGVFARDPHPRLLSG